jgi:hypothetical protein
MFNAVGVPLNTEPGFQGALVVGSKLLGRPVPGDCGCVALSVSTPLDLWGRGLLNDYLSNVILF